MVRVTRGQVHSAGAVVPADVGPDLQDLESQGVKGRSSEAGEIPPVIRLIAALVGEPASQRQWWQAELRSTMCQEEPDPTATGGQANRLSQELETHDYPSPPVLGHTIRIL